MKQTTENDYFVYQNWTDEKLYSKGLSRKNDNRIYEFLSAQAVIKYKQPSKENILACVGDRLVRIYF